VLAAALQQKGARGELNEVSFEAFACAIQRRAQVIKISRYLTALHAQA